MRIVARFAIALVSVSLSAASVAQVPEGTRVVAETELQELISLAHSGGNFLFHIDAKSFQKATLGEPFVARWAIHNEFFGYENADPARILDFASQHSYRYPVMVANEMLGAIAVREDTSASGQYWCSGETIGSSYKHILALRKQYPPEAGYEASVLQTEGAGTFFVIQHNSVTEYVVPAERNSAYALSLIPADVRPDENATYPVIPIEKAAPAIKAAVAELRKQVEKGGGGFGIRDLPPPDTLR
jgi:hypothetical protein